MGLISLEEVLEFCNKVRAAGGANPLDALLPAIPQQPNECLIALNLNFSCFVEPGGSIYFEDTDGSMINRWVMIIHDIEVAENIATELDLDFVTTGNNQVNVGVILLPEEIGDVAYAFDKWIEYPEWYPEFDKYVADTVHARLAELEYNGLSRDAFAPGDVEQYSNVGVED